MEKEQLIALVKKSQSGDRAAIEELLRYAHTSVSYQCRKILNNEQDAEDMTQEVLVTIYTKLDTLQEPAAFWKWANQITTSRCINALNRTHVEYQFAEDEEGHSILDNLEELDEQVIPDKAIDNAETARMIEEIVEGLPDAQRAATLMFYYDEMSVKEIAQTMQVSENTVKSRLNYARKAIKEKVLDYEKQGVKLYGLSPLPFLLYFLRLAAKNSADKDAAGVMVAEVMATEGAAVGAATASAAGAGSAAAATGGSVATAAGSTAATGIFAGISAKVVAGVLAAVVTIGSVAAAVIPNTQADTTEPTTVSTEATSPMETESMLETEAPTTETITEPTEPETTEPATEAAPVETESMLETEASTTETITEPTEPETIEPATEATTAPVETESADTAAESAVTEPTQTSTEPTGSSGNTEYETCSSCGIGQIVPVNLTQDPCATRLEVAFQCNHCGTIAGYSYPSGNGHTYGITEDGQCEICTVCGTILGPTDIGHGGVTDETEHVHSYDSVVTAPTCTAGGYTTYTCACGDSYIGNETPASHDYTNEVTTDATCTTDGVKTYTCKGCGHSYTESITGKHDYSSEVTSEPACDHSGTRTYTCKTCGYSYNEEIPSTEHDWTDWGVNYEPTTEREGQEIRRCKTCGYYDFRTIDKLPTDEPVHQHNYKSETTRTPNCTDMGRVKYTCSCGSSYEEDTPALGHDWGEWYESNFGQPEHKCKTCGLVTGEAMDWDDFIGNDSE